MDFEIYLGGIAKFVGYLAVIYGFYRVISQDWGKKRKEISEAKIKAEADSHAPIVEKIDAMREELSGQIKSVKDELDKIRKEQQSDRDLNKQIARLSLAMADENGERSGTNGKTKKAAQDLREILLQRA
jgi:hypothetical protein